MFMGRGGIPVLKCDAVFQGGGVKGIGFVGAVSVIENAGYEFVNLAGTSAGAIVAALLAVGYTGAEIEKEIMGLDYQRFCEQTRLGWLGLLGKALSLGLFLGIYKTDSFERWLNGLLERKGRLVFGDILTGSPDDKYKYRFQAVASDVSHRKMLVLPGDLAEFGIDPDEFSIARAVRMSMSIPFYFVPHRLTGQDSTSLVVDGGLLSNYPVWLLDNGTNDPKWPTFGFKFTGEHGGYSRKTKITNMHEYSKAVVGTLLEAHDNREISTHKGDHSRSIMISTEIHIGGKRKKIKTTDFDITQEESRALYKNGAEAAECFLSGWDFEKWKRFYRV
jgi:NTE family protein